MSPGERAREEARLRDEFYDRPLPRGKCIRIGVISFDKDGKLKVKMDRSPTQKKTKQPPTP